MEELHKLMTVAIDKLNNNVKPVFDSSKWELTGEKLDVIDCYDHEEVVESVCGTYTGVGVVSCGVLVAVNDIEFKID